MAAEVFPVARIDEYAKPCEPAIHVWRSVTVTHIGLQINAMYRRPVNEAKYNGTSSVNIGKTGRLQSIQI